MELTQGMELAQLRIERRRAVRGAAFGVDGLCLALPCGGLLARRREVSRLPLERHEIVHDGLPVEGRPILPIRPRLARPARPLEHPRLRWLLLAAGRQPLGCPLLPLIALLSVIGSLLQAHGRSPVPFLLNAGQLRPEDL